MKTNLRAKNTEFPRKLFFDSALVLQARTRAELTQADVAKILSVSQASYSKREKQAVLPVSLSQGEELAFKLGSSVAQLVLSKAATRQLRLARLFTTISSLTEEQLSVIESICRLDTHTTSK